MRSDTRTHTRERARDYFDVLTINAGYYPAGVQGVGGSAVMFVLSTDYWFGGTWYMLNQSPYFLAQFISPNLIKIHLE